MTIFSVYYQHESLRSKALEISDQMQVPLILQLQECVTEFCLIIDEQGISMTRPADRKLGHLRVDFCQGSMDWRRQHGGGTGQAVAKAVGLKQAKRPLHILDATAGMGVDSFILASLGCHVTLIERNPYVACLLEDGINRALNHETTHDIAQRMTLLKDSSIQLMKQYSDKPIDVVYLDPMFPHSAKSAQVKKAMQYFRDMVGADSDADQLLKPALDIAEYRVVVKRPRKSPYLNQQVPTTSHEGKSNRFDIYVNKSLS